MLPRFWPHSALLVVYLHPFSLPPASRTQQLCVKLEPRGLLYVKLTLLEQWAAPTPRLSELPPPSVFAVELRHLVEKEACVPKVPLIIQKCVAEIERRGLKVKFGKKKKVEHSLFRRTALSLDYGTRLLWHCLFRQPYAKSRSFPSRVVFNFTEILSWET